ncbi:MAG: DUF255 domain-containing protein [Planctomycetes bacterium]|nr:DUF255 domain-containing protein [Planctomycetota bacterium]
MLTVLKSTICNLQSAMALASALLLAPWPALALEGFELPPFQVASTLAPNEAPAGGELTLTVTFTLRPDVHLYEKSIKFQWDELRGVAEKEIVKPRGKLIPDLSSTVAGATTEAYEGSATVTVTFQITGAAGEKAIIKGTVGYQGCTDRQCFRPAKFAIAHEAAIVAAAAEAKREEMGWLALLKHLLKALAAGLALGLTPCVYPMIPITAAIIGARKDAPRLQAILLSAVYVLGIALTYAVLGALVAALGQSVRLVFLKPPVLVGIGVLFTVFALAMFDVFTLQAPAFVTRLAERGGGSTKGLTAILALGAVSGLAAGPCVAGPLLAVLTDIAAIGNPALGAAMMFLVAWGMGVWLIAAGASASFLPKAGPWMVWVKHLIGFVLLWAALYFVRPVIRETAFWLGSAGVLVAATVFLGGLDALTPESGFGARAKRVLGIVALAAAGWCALVGLGLEPRAGVGTVPGVAQADPFLHGDPGLFKEALAAGKPIVLDFTAEWCGYCKVLDRTTFADPAVVAELNRFRALKIDVDTGRNAELVTRFDVPGPPIIVVLDSKGGVVKKLGYDEAKDPDKFAEFLRGVQ